MENKENEDKNFVIFSNTRNAEVKRDSEFSLSHKMSLIRESLSDSGVLPRKSSSVADVTKRSSLPSQDQEVESPNNSQQDEHNVKVPRKFITTWRHACDRTKDKTKELLKRWKTLPEGNTEMLLSAPAKPTATENTHNWSVHVWASYIKRYPSEDENLLTLDKDKEVATPSYTLSATQKEKLGHFFLHLIDIDHDDLISEQDFEHFSERLRRFADWSTNSPEFFIMNQVQQGFVSTFLSENSPNKGDGSPKPERWKQYIGLEEWFQCWSVLLSGAFNLQDFPFWLQYLPKLFFQAINKSGSGTITRDELCSFYSSMLAFTPQRVGEILDEAYKALTSNGDHHINYQVYRLAFTNFLLGRHPNGPGQYVLGCVGKKSSCFPIDYSALNCQPEDREHYTPDRRSNRVSVVV